MKTQGSYLHKLKTFMTHNNVDDVDFVVERVFDLWGLILEKFGGFDLFVVY